MAGKQSQVVDPEIAIWPSPSLCPQTACVFLPAPFDLVELDDAMLVDGRRPARVLLHANGLVTEPAEQVLLGWISSTGAQAETATRRYTGPISPQESGRFDAIHLAGSPAPDGVNVPLLPLEEWAPLQATSGTGDPRWHRVEIALDDRPTQAEAIDTDHGSFGWLSHVDLVIAFTLRHLPMHNLRLRTITQDTATNYPCNPLTPRTWHEFTHANRR